MDAADWVDVVEAVVWPITVLLALIMLSPRLPRIGREVKDFLKDRDVTANVPGLELSAYKPTVQQLDDEERALQKEAAAATDPELKAELTRLAAEVAATGQSLERLNEDLNSPTLSDSGYFARRLADRAYEDASDAAKVERSLPTVIRLRGVDFELREVGDILLLKQLNGLTPRSPETYADFVEAGRLLRLRDLPTSDPPFTLLQFVSVIRDPE